MAPQRRCAGTLLFLVAATVASAARDLDAANPLPAAAAGTKPDPAYHGGYGGGAIPGIPLPPGGYYGGGGGYAHGGVEVPTVVCQEKGPCYGKKVACPKRCFWSYSRSGNGYGAGGGGGSCTVDCRAKCTATC